METKRFSTLEELLSFGFPIDEERDAIRIMVREELRTNLIQPAQLDKVLAVDYPLDPRDSSLLRAFTQEQVQFADQRYGILEYLALPREIAEKVSKRPLSDEETDLTAPYIVIYRLLARQSFDDPKDYVRDLIKSVDDPSVIKIPRAERLRDRIQKAVNYIWLDDGKNQSTGGRTFMVNASSRGFNFTVEVKYVKYIRELLGGYSITFSIPALDNSMVPQVPGVSPEDKGHEEAKAAFLARQRQSYPFFPVVGKPFLILYALPEPLVLGRRTFGGKSPYFDNAVLYHPRASLRSAWKFNEHTVSDAQSCNVYVDAEYLERDNSEPDSQRLKDADIVGFVHAMTRQKSQVYSLDDYIARVDPKVDNLFLVAALARSLLIRVKRKLYNQIF